MPLPILGWVAAAVGTAAAGYAAKKIFGDNDNNDDDDYDSPEKARKRARNSKNKKIKLEAETIRVELVKKFKDKYNEQLIFSNSSNKNIASFSSQKTRYIKQNIESLKAGVDFSSIKNLSSQKDSLEAENKKLLELKNTFEKLRYEGN